MEGKVGVFKGIVPLIDEFMLHKGFSKEKKEQIRLFLQFLIDRSKGEVRTGAKFLRDLVVSSPNYKQDSVVNEKVMFDLLSVVKELDVNEETREQFLGKYGSF